MGARMSEPPSWAFTTPSENSTMEWILLWRWTSTRTSSMGTWKRWCASMTSRPLFMRLAESMVIFAPMSQVG